MPPENEGTNESDFIDPNDPDNDVEDNEAQLSDVDNDDLDQGEDLDGDDPDSPDKSDEEDAEEFEEIERDGKKARIPAWLKPELMMHADYTRKTQATAERAKALEQEEARIRESEQALYQQAETQRQNLRDYAQLMSVDQQIEQYQKLDWAAIERDDPLRASSLFREMQQLKDHRQQMAAGIQQKEMQARQEAAQRTQAAQQASNAELAKRREHTFHAVKSKIPGWNDEIAGKVSQFAQSEGYSVQELLQATTDPRAFVLLYKAWKGQQIIDQQKAAAKKAKTQSQADAAPLTNVSKGRQKPITAGLDDRLSADEWIRRRNEQLRKRA